MTQRRRAQKLVSSGMIWTATVLLVGIVVLAAGHYQGNRIAFYAGVLVTLAGVLAGVQQLVVPREP